MLTWQLADMGCSWKVQRGWGVGLPRIKLRIKLLRVGGLLGCNLQPVGGVLRLN